MLSSSTTTSNVEIAPPPGPTASTRTSGIRRFAAAGLVMLTAGAGLTLAAQPASAATATEAAAARSVFNTLNAERRAHGLPALGWSTALVQSSRNHNAAMNAKNTMSHQLPGEAALGQRVTAVKVVWHAVAENVGWTSQLSAAGAVSIQSMMYNEKAPNDGHRVNILSRSVRYVGVDVVMDAATHRLWLTEDFADAPGPAAAPSAAAKAAAAKAAAAARARAAAAVVAAHSPRGHLDAARTLSGHRINITGWAFDPDHKSTPLKIALYADSKKIGTFGSGRLRADVARVYRTGPRQGFNLTAKMPAGKHRTCLIALNVSSPGVNRIIGCRVTTT